MILLLLGTSSHSNRTDGSLTAPEINARTKTKRGKVVHNMQTIKLYHILSLIQSEDCDQLKADNKRLKINLTETKRYLFFHPISFVCMLQ